MKRRIMPRRIMLPRQAGLGVKAVFEVKPDQGSRIFGAGWYHISTCD